MGVLYLLRHGQASFGQDNYDRLSEMGRRQARLIGRHLQRANLTVDAAYCGPMDRQRHTAEEALAQLESPPPLVDAPEFREYDSPRIIFSALPALTAEDPALADAAENMFSDRRLFQAVYEKAMHWWVSGQTDSEAGESWLEFIARVEHGLDRVRADSRHGRTVAVFTSGGPISVAVRQALELSDQKALGVSWVVKNASLSSFLYNGRYMTLSSFNSTAHLEREADPELITYR